MKSSPWEKTTCSLPYTYLSNLHILGFQNQQIKIIIKKLKKKRTHDPIPPHTLKCTMNLPLPLSTADTQNSATHRRHRVFSMPHPDRKLHRSRFNWGCAVHLAIKQSWFSSFSLLHCCYRSSMKILPMKSRNLLEYSFGSTAEIEVGSTCKDLYACSSFLLMS